jgi:hypothetical protein
MTLEVDQRGMDVGSVCQLLSPRQYCAVVPAVIAGSFVPMSARSVAEVSLIRCRSVSAVSWRAVVRAYRTKTLALSERLETREESGTRARSTVMESWIRASVNARCAVMESVRNEMSPGKKALNVGTPLDPLGDMSA